MFKTKKMRALELERNHLRSVLENISAMKHASGEMLNEYAREKLNNIKNTDYKNKFN